MDSPSVFSDLKQADVSLTLFLYLLLECAIFRGQNIHQSPATNGHWHVHDFFQIAAPENIEEQ